MLLVGAGLAQTPYLLRHMGGNFLQDDVYQIDIFNPSSRVVNIGGYTLVTRQFVARLPGRIRIEPGQTFSLGKGPGPTGKPSLEFEQIPDFLVRIPRNIQEGDYLMLLNRSGKPVDAFYYASGRKVSFLPDADTLITFSRTKIPFAIPGESDPVWKYLSLSPDPALAFMRIEGRWQAGSRKRNTFPATAYDNIEARYVDGVVTIEGSSQFERDALNHRVERSLDGRNFTLVEQVPAKGQPTRYRVYDPGVKQGKRYYYRLRHIDRFGFEVRSSLVEVHADDRDADLSLEPFVTSANKLNIRLYTRTDQQLRLKVIDEQGREWALRFYDSLQAGGRYLMRFDESIPQGRYRVVVTTPERRYYKAFMVE